MGGGPSVPGLRRGRAAQPPASRFLAPACLRGPAAPGHPGKSACGLARGRSASAVVSCGCPDGLIDGG